MSVVCPAPMAFHGCVHRHTTACGSLWAHKSGGCTSAVHLSAPSADTNTGVMFSRVLAQYMHVKVMHRLVYAHTVGMQIPLRSPNVPNGPQTRTDYAEYTLCVVHISIPLPAIKCRSRLGPDMRLEAAGRRSTGQGTKDDRAT